MSKISNALTRFKKHWYFPASIMLTVALTIPIAWEYWDTQHRLELKQIAFVGCLTHHETKDIETCERMRPSVLAPATYQLCLWRFSGAECERYKNAR